MVNTRLIDVQKPTASKTNICPMKIGLSAIQQFPQKPRFPSPILISAIPDCTKLLSRICYSKLCYLIKPYILFPNLLLIKKIIENL